MTKTLVEGCFSLDTAHIKKNLGRARIHQENISGQLVGILAGKRLIINYWFEYEEEDSLAVSINGRLAQRIGLSTQAITFGTRTYLVCECGKKVSKLYLADHGGDLRCRKCLGLTYELNTINKDTVHGRFFYQINRMIKLANKSEAMARIFYKGRYTKAFLRNLRMMAKAGFPEKGLEARGLMENIWA
ncbi:MAG: hypothetical protein WCO84_01910 [bacterium]